MRTNAQNAIRILKCHIKDGYTRQTGTERNPICATVSGVIDTDVRAGKQIV